MPEDAIIEAERTTLPVSVVIPAYNRADLVARAVTSVMAQRPLPPADVIVIDDCSDDATAQVAEGLGARVLRHDVNRGAATARNTGIMAATGEWIALLDSDDEWLPHHLATLWGLRDGHVLAAGATLLVRPEGGSAYYYGPPRGDVVTIETPAQVIYPFSPFPASSVMVRRDVMQSIGGYDTALRFAEDWDLWVRVLEQGTGIQTPRVISLYHMHPGQKSLRRPSSVHHDIVNKYVSREWCTPALRERRLGVMVFDALRAAQRDGRRRDVLERSAELATHPRRLQGAVGLAVHRERQRRRSSELHTDGGPTVAVMEGVDRLPPEAAALVEGREAARATRSGDLRGLLRLAVRPPSLVVADSRLKARALRALGVRAVSAS